MAENSSTRREMQMYESDKSEALVSCLETIAGKMKELASMMSRALRTVKTTSRESIPDS